MTHTLYALPVLLLVGLGITVLATRTTQTLRPGPETDARPYRDGAAFLGLGSRCEAPDTGGPPPLTHESRDRPHTRGRVDG